MVLNDEPLTTIYLEEQDWDTYSKMQIAGVEINAKGEDKLKIMFKNDIGYRYALNFRGVSFERMGDVGSIPDSDNDGWNDSIDNCMWMANPEQYDFDHDGVGDFCIGSAIDENADVKAGISIYPNPIIDFLYFTSNSAIVSLRIYNVYGHLLADIDGASVMDRISMEDYQSGLYIIEIIDVSGHSYISRVMKR